MRSENTIVFVLALLSGHSDVVDAMPGAWARSKAGGEGVGGRDARSLSSAPDEVADEVVVRGESDGKSNQLVARQWPTVPAPPTSYENLAKWFSDTMVIAGGSIGTAFFVYWSGTKIYVAVLRSGYVRQTLNSAGIELADIERSADHALHGAEIVEEVVDQLPT